MKLSLVVPVFNEEEAIPIFYQTVQDILVPIYPDLELVFVNDGSTDTTALVLDNLSNRNPQLVIVDFSRNFGKEPALFAGLAHSSGDAVIPIDVDLQDPIDVIPRLVAAFHEGADVVLAQRADRSTDTFLKRHTAALFYRIHNAIAKPPLPPNVGDFRLMSRAVVDAITALPENQLFMKGLLSWVGYKTVIVQYTRASRVAGTSKFNGWRLWNLAIEGFTSFSTLPLRIWTYLGVLVSALSFVYAMVIIVHKLFYDIPVSGYPSIMVTILFLGGVQLIGIGVLGEYIGRTYMESKRRPRYVIRNIRKHSDSK